jgi:hypothetical protein
VETSEHAEQAAAAGDSARRTPFRRLCKLLASLFFSLSYPVF